MLKFKEENLTFYRTLKGYLDGKYVGRIDFDYNKYLDELKLIMVFVDKDYRRQGVASKLLRYLQDKYGEIIWNGKTKDGESLYKAYYSNFK